MGHYGPHKANAKIADVIRRSLVASAAEARVDGAEQMRDRIGPNGCGDQCSPQECEAAALLQELRGDDGEK